jgi:hypothetical protein
MSPPTRGALYIVWGDFNKKALDRSIASFQNHHPDLPIHLETLADGSTLLDKADMFNLSPFDETVFLDADTIVLGRLDFGFNKALQFGVAICICECPWARRYAGIKVDIIEYNTGVIFFTKASKPLFDVWNKRVRDIDSSIVFVLDGQEGHMSLNDQAGFAVAVEEVGAQPFILPHNWNFRPKWQKSWYGPLIIWHDYAEPPVSLLSHNKKQFDPAQILLSSSLN